MVLGVEWTICGLSVWALFFRRVLVEVRRILIIFGGWWIARPALSRIHKGDLDIRAPLGIRFHIEAELHREAYYFDNEMGSAIPEVVPVNDRKLGFRDGKNHVVAPHARLSREVELALVIVTALVLDDDVHVRIEVIFPLFGTQAWEYVCADQRFVSGGQIPPNFSIQRDSGRPILSAVQSARPLNPA